jgi:RHS repeat-associated protein
MSDATGGNGTSPADRAKRSYVYGTYVDEVLAYVTGTGATAKRYYPHANHLYSVAALTDQADVVVERYTYDAYGTQKITDGSGNVTRAKSSVGWDRGFTGYITDNETGLLHARARQYSPPLGRFIARDAQVYVDGLGLYAAYFIPCSLDPSGEEMWSLSADGGGGDITFNYDVDCKNGKISNLAVSLNMTLWPGFKSVKMSYSTIYKNERYFIEHWRAGSSQRGVANVVVRTRAISCKTSNGQLGYKTVTDVKASIHSVSVIGWSFRVKNDQKEALNVIAADGFAMVRDQERETITKWHGVRWKAPMGPECECMCDAVSGGDSAEKEVKVSNKRFRLTGQP